MVEDDGGENMIGDRNTKKVRFKGLDFDSENDMVVDSILMPEISWRDKVLGRGVPGYGKEEDFELLDGDVTRSTVNGIPVISFSERVQQILFREMATTVVVKLLGRNLSYSILQNRIQSLRILSQQFHLMDMENGYLLVKFQSRVDYDKVLTQGPWIVLGQYLTVQPWTSEFDSLHKLSLAMRWYGSGCLVFRVSSTNARFWRK